MTKAKSEAEQFLLDNFNITEEIIMSEKLSLAGKIAKIKKQLGTVTKDSKAHKSRYASLSSIYEKVNELCEANGVLVHLDSFEPLPRTDNAITVKENIFRLKLLVKSTDSEEEFPMTTVVIQDTTMPQPVQSGGATMTYGMRYAYGLLFSIAFDDDDPDANGGGKPILNTMKPIVQNENALITTPQQDQLVLIMKNKGLATEQVKEVIQNAGYKSSAEIKVKDFALIKNTLENL